MLFHTIFRCRGKNFLVLLVGILIGSIRSDVRAATLTLDNGGTLSGGINIWNVDNNWDLDRTPLATDTAVIPTGLGSGANLFITNGTLSTSAAVGTLIIDAAASQFPRVRPTQSFNRDATITFGTTSVDAALVYSPPGELDEITFAGIRFDQVSDGTLMFNVPRSLGSRKGGHYSLFNEL